METAISNNSDNIPVLLKRLYDYKSDNSEIISQIVREITELDQAKESIIAKMEDANSALSNVEHKTKDLEKEYAYFEKTISPINANAFNTLFEETGIYLDLNAIKTQITTSYPQIIENKRNEIDTRQKEINVADYNGQLKDIEARRSELDLKKIEALKNKQSLQELMEKVFNRDEGLSRGLIKNILSLFGFTEDELETLFNVLIIPEGALADFDREYNHIPGKSVVDIVRTAKEAQNEAVPDVSVADEKEITFDFTAGPSSLPIAKKSELDSILDKMGLDITKFNTEQIAQMEQITNEEYLLTNYELMNAMNISPYEYFSLFIDLNLKFKVHQFLELNKNYTDIRKCLKVLEIDVNKMQTYFDMLGDHGYDINKIPLIVYVYDPKTYIDNIIILNQNGYNIDDKQIYNCAVDLLIDSTLLTNNLRIIKEYNINITNSEGKINLKILALDSRTLEQNAIKLIEAGAEHILDQEPGILTSNADEVIARIAYCQENKIPYQTNGLTNDYLSFIFKQSEFEQVLQKQVDLAPYLPVENNINQVLINELPQGKDIVAYINENNLSVPGVSTSIEQINLYTKNIERIADQTKRAFVINGIFFAKARVISNIKKMDFNTNAFLFDNSDVLILVAMFINSNKKADDFYQAKLKVDQPETFGGPGL